MTAMTELEHWHAPPEVMHTYRVTLKIRGRRALVRVLAERAVSVNEALWIATFREGIEYVNIERCTIEALPEEGT